MKYIGEGNAYRRSKNSQVLIKARTVYRHNSGESLEWAPKVQRCVYTHPYLSGQWTEQNNNYSIAIRAADKPEYQIIYSGFFIYLGNLKNERGNHHVGNIECN